MTKKNNCATVIVTAVCGLFAFVATVDAVGWRGDCGKSQLSRGCPSLLCWKFANIMRGSS